MSKTHFFREHELERSLRYGEATIDLVQERRHLFDGVTCACNAASRRFRDSSNTKCVACGNPVPKLHLIRMGEFVDGTFIQVSVFQRWLDSKPLAFGKAGSDRLYTLSGDPVYCETVHAEVILTNFGSTCLNLEHVFTDSLGNHFISEAGGVDPFKSRCIKQVRMFAGSGACNSTLVLRKPNADGASEMDVILTLHFAVPERGL